MLDCPSDLWTPGVLENLDFQTLDTSPGAAGSLSEVHLSEARFPELPRTQTWGGSQCWAAKSLDTRGRRAPAAQVQGSGPRARWQGCQTRECTRTEGWPLWPSHLHFWLFFIPHLQCGALSSLPTRPTEDWGCGERGGLEPDLGAKAGAWTKGSRVGFPPLAPSPLSPPFPCLSDPTPVLLSLPCPPSFSRSPIMIVGTNPVFTGVGPPVYAH